VLLIPFLLSLFQWVGDRCVGEYLIRRFDMELKADIQEGERWQKKLDEKDGIDRKKNIQQVRHSWQWNEELKGWRERKAKAKQRFSVVVVSNIASIVHVSSVCAMYVQIQSQCQHSRVPVLRAVRGHHVLDGVHDCGCHLAQASSSNAVPRVDTRLRVVAVRIHWKL
jgi:hypothetical protein